MTQPHGEYDCHDCHKMKDGKSEPPEWFAKAMVALIAFIIVVITLAIVL